MSCLGKLRGLEQRRAAAIAAEPEAETETETESTGADSEGRELRELTDKAALSDIFISAVDQSATEGATRELQQHFELGANQVPLSLFAEDGPEETPGRHRCTWPTSAEGSCRRYGGRVSLSPWPHSSAFQQAYCGSRADNGAGAELLTQLYGRPAESAEAAETDGAFTAENLSPSRLQASFRYSREDAASFAGMDEALRANLRMALSDGLDKAVISGTNGLLTGTNRSPITMSPPQRPTRSTEAPSPSAELTAPTLDRFPISGSSWAPRRTGMRPASSARTMQAIAQRSKTWSPLRLAFASLRMCRASAATSRTRSYT